MDGNNAIEALSNNKMGMRPAVGAGRHYPSTPDRMANALFGPTAGKGVEAAGMIGNVMSGNASARDWRKARDFVPGNNLSFLSPAFDAAFPPARPGRHSQTNPAARNPGGPP
jgi:hypothetical protein